MIEGCEYFLQSHVGSIPWHDLVLLLRTTVGKRGAYRPSRWQLYKGSISAALHNFVASIKLWTCPTETRTACPIWRARTSICETHCLVLSSRTGYRMST